VDEDKRNPRPSGSPSDSNPRDSELEDLYRGVQPEMRRPKPSPDALAAALEVAQRLAAEADAEQAAADTAQELTNDSTIVCRVCGYRNRTANKYCGMCGIAVSEPEAGSRFPAEGERPQSRALALPRNPFPDPDGDAEFEPERKPAASRSLGPKLIITITTIITTIFLADRTESVRDPRAIPSVLIRRASCDRLRL